METLRQNLWSTIVAGILALLLLVYLFTFQVPAGSWGVVYRLGRFVKTHETPGLKFKWPAPIDKIELLDRRVRLFETKLQEGLTADKTNLMVTITTGWRITEPTLFIERLKTVEDAEKNLRSLVDNARNTAFGEFYFHDLVNVESAKQQENSTRIQALMKGRLNEKLKAAGYGLTVEFLAVQKLTFPGSVSEQVINRMKAERAKESERFRSEGKGKAREIVSAAEADSKRILAEARAKAEIKMGQGDAEAASYYGVFKENPELANYLRETKTLRQVLTKQTTAILSTRNVPFNLLEQNAPPNMKK
ncbi:MAG: protease modulator HflC [Planctomycetota bacterium]